MTRHEHRRSYEPPELRAITVLQPYATLIALGLKRIETRPWGTLYRGRLAIHAGAGRELIAPGLEKAAIRTALARFGIEDEGQLPLGCFVAVTSLTLIDRIRGERDRPPEPERSFGDYAAGRYAWHLSATTVSIEEPIPARGVQRLWHPQPEHRALLLEEYRNGVARRRRP